MTRFRLKQRKLNRFIPGQTHFCTFFIGVVVISLLSFSVPAAADGVAAGGARIGEIIILGNSRTGEEVIQRQLPFSPGDYWRDEYLDLTITRLKAMNCFDPLSLRVITEPLPGGELRVVVRASDTHILYLDPLEFFIINIQNLFSNYYTQTFYNPFGTGLNLTASGGWGANPWIGLGFNQSLSKGWFLKGNLQWSENHRWFYPLDNPPSFSSTGFFTSISLLRYTFGDCEYGGTINYSPVQVSLDGADSLNQAYLSIGPDCKWSGWLECRLSLRYVLDSTGNFPSYPAASTVLLRRSRIGENELLTTLYAGSMAKSAPLNRQFTIGGFGPVPIRGFSPAFTGHTYLSASLEYRHLLSRNSWLLAFVDYGRAWSDHERTTGYDWESGAGVGLAVGTPLGYPVRLDLAYGLTGGGLAWRIWMDKDF
ncbi:MAG TPA: BamA/TamA family outer membrane protein [Firmicutes bacterium]|nr:BamA/TamA family outer membrane protein [Bacillota bacterium]